MQTSSLCLIFHCGCRIIIRPDKSFLKLSDHIRGKSFFVIFLVETVFVTVLIAENSLSIWWIDFFVDKIRIKHDAKSFYFQFARLILWNFIFLSRLIVLWKTEFHFQRSMWLLLYLLKALIYSSLYIYSFFDRWNKNFDPITLFVFPILEISETFKKYLFIIFHSPLSPFSHHDSSFIDTFI